MKITEREEEAIEVAEAAEEVVAVEDVAETTKIENMGIDQTTETERDHNIERNKNLRVKMTRKKNKSTLLRRRAQQRGKRETLKLMKATSPHFD